MSVSCVQAKEEKKSKLEDVCKQAFELSLKTDSPTFNDYLENYDLLIRDYPDFEKLIARETFESNGFLSQLTVIGMVAGLASAYRVYVLDMSFEDFEKYMKEQQSGGKK